MKISIYSILFIISLLIIQSCAKEDDILVESNPTPSSFSVNTSNTNAFSINLEWSKASISDKSTIKYDIFLANKLISKDLTENKYTINDLESETTYTGKIVAKSNKGKTREETFTFTTKKDEIPSVFEVNIEILSKSEVQISWTESTLSSGEKIVYDISLYSSYYNKEILIKNISELKYKFNKLYHGSMYTLKVTAKSQTGKRITIEKKFQPYGTPPSNFTLSYEEINPTNILLKWKHPTVADGSDYHYKLYINDILIRSFNNAGASSTLIQNIKEGVEHKIILIADAQNNTKTEATLIFTARVYPSPSDDFIISAQTLTSTKLLLDWTPSTMTDGTQVYYYLYVNGERYLPGNYFGRGGVIFENLLPDTEYTFTVEAEEQKFRKKISKDFTFRTYPVHPNIKVNKAVFFSKESKNFREQLNVKFNQKIENVNITYFHAGLNIEIPNFIFYPSSISSQRLEGYLFYKNNPYGYVLIKENTKTYIVSFDVVLETN